VQVSVSKGRKLEGAKLKDLHTSDEIQAFCSTVILQSTVKNHSNNTEQKIP
jgi:hypothetical protein